MKWSSPRRKEKRRWKGSYRGIGLYIQEVQAFRLWNNRIFGVVPNLMLLTRVMEEMSSLSVGSPPLPLTPRWRLYRWHQPVRLDTYIPRFLILKGSKCCGVRKGLYTAAMPWAGVLNIITASLRTRRRVRGDQRRKPWAATYSAGFRAPLVKDRLFIGVAGLLKVATLLYE